MANYPVPYQNTWGYSGVGQQMYPQYQQSMTAMQPAVQNQYATVQSGHGIKWVDGEVGAKAFQMPNGWPPNQPIDLWDTNDTVIYLKSINPMGMPNPLQKIHYTLEGQSNRESQFASSRDSDPMPDMTQYVKKEDLERLKQDLVDTIGQMNTTGTGVRKNTTKGE